MCRLCAILRTSFTSFYFLLLSFTFFYFYSGSLFCRFSSFSFSFFSFQSLFSLCSLCASEPLNPLQFISSPRSPFASRHDRNTLPRPVLQPVSRGRRRGRAVVTASAPCSARDARAPRIPGQTFSVGRRGPERVCKFCAGRSFLRCGFH